MWPGACARAGVSLGHEAEFRDGLHGGLVWAVGVIIGAALFLSSAGAAVRTGAQAVSGATAMAAGSTNDPLDVALDTMLRPMTTAQATPAASPPSPGSGASASAPTPRARAASAPADESRSEMSRILATAVASGSLSEPSRAYLTQTVAQRAGISQQEADKRVTEAFNAAREAADKARRAAVLTGFVTAASLILSLGAAWWAALKGGQHRDNSIPARFAFGDRRRPTPTS